MGGNYFILRFDLVFYELGGAGMTKIQVMLIKLNTCKKIICAKVCILQNLTFLWNMFIWPHMGNLHRLNYIKISMFILVQ